MTRRKSLNIFDNGKIRNMIRVVLLVAIFLISDIKIFANNSVCEKIYSDCFYNIPKKMITYYKPYNKVGFVNKNSINLRDIPIINSKNSKIVLKLKKNDKIEIKKIFYLKNNTHVNLKLANSSNFEKVNNYRYKKWYLVSFGNTSGYIFSDFVNIVEDTTWLKRYRHVESTNWSKDKIKLQKNIEITIERDDSNNEYLLKGFAWDYSQGYKEITKKFLINPEVIGTFNDDDLKIFFFDEKEIYVESNDSVFTGIYKKY